MSCVNLIIICHAHGTKLSKQAEVECCNQSHDNFKTPGKKNLCKKLHNVPGVLKTYSVIKCLNLLFNLLKYYQKFTVSQYIFFV